MEYQQLGLPPRIQIEQGTTIKRARSPADVGNVLHEAYVLKHLETQQLAPRLLDQQIDHRGLPYLIIQHVHGLPLDSYLKLPVASNNLLGLYRNLVSKVARLHKTGWLHCDIKPDNVIVSPGKEGIEAHLIDFGQAYPRFDTQVSPDRRFVPSRSDYQAPEAALTAYPTPDMDVFSLGVILHDLVNTNEETDLLRNDPEISKLLKTMTTSAGKRPTIDQVLENIRVA